MLIEIKKIKSLVVNKNAQAIGTMTIFVGMMRLAAMAASILLARMLTEDDFGEFVLVRTLVLIIPPIAAWGQNISAARFFSTHDISQYNWHGAFTRAMKISIVLCVISSLIAAWYYQRFDAAFLMLIFLPTVAYCSNFFIANVIRSQKKYLVSMFINEGFRLVFIILVLALLISGILNKHSASWTFAWSLVLVGGFAFWYSKSLPQGHTPVPSEMNRDAIMLMVLTVSIDIIGNMDRLLVAGNLSMEDLALYAAVFAPLQIYMVFNRASHWVLIPLFGNQKKIGFWNYSFVTLIIAFLLTLPFILAGKDILHLLYGGKYDRGACLLAILAVAQAARLFYTMASSLIIGRLRQSVLQMHMWISIISVILYFAGTYWGIIYYGITGAALAVLCTQLLRMVGAYVIVYCYRNDWSRVNSDLADESNGIN